jgi:hypothetical protein
VTYCNVLNSIFRSSLKRETRRKKEKNSHKKEENEMSKNLQIHKNKVNKKLFAIIAVVLLILSATLFCLPASARIATDVPTSCRLSLRPNPIGVGQELLINGWRSPTPYSYSDLGLTPPSTASASDGIPFDFRMLITKPNGEVLNVYPIASDGPGTFWLSYTVDTVGTWNFTLIWEGDEYFQPSSVTQMLVVQQEAIASYPAAELPTNQWTYPVSPENREWGSIIGGWFQPKYDSSASNFNPYSQAPRTAHVLWTAAPASGLAGLIGGDQPITSRYTASSYTIRVIMAGRAYSNSAGNLTCFDMRTGEILWTRNGSFTVGAIRSGVPSLYEFGTTFRVYNGLTGAVTLEVPGMTMLGGSQGIAYGYEDPYVYSAQTVGGKDYLLKWTTAGSTTNFTERIIWNVTNPFAPELPYNLTISSNGVTWNGDIMMSLQWPTNSESGAINTTTGEVLWHKTIGPPDVAITSRGSFGSTNGLGVCPVVLPEDAALAAWNMTTGEIEWFSEQTADPWGAFFGYQYTSAYDIIYRLTYAGVYAFNSTNGKILWYYSSGDAGMETPYNIQASGDSGLEKTTTQWPFGSNEGVIADGVLFAPNSEHSPTVYYRGQQLHAIDAYSGTKIWSIMGYYTVSAIAEGTLFATNAYDGNAYAFAKGSTATTVSVQNDVYTKGSSILIKGTVMDLSPAQPNTPAVSDDSMTGWMEYLHMQQPKPTNTTGVSIHLTAIDTNGKSIDLGTTTSDASGIFAMMWTPSAEGKYTIVANFAGSNSYYGSSAETVVGVSATSSSSSSASPSTTSSQSTASPGTSVSPSTSGAVSPSAVQSQAPSSTGTSSTTIYIAIAAVVVIVAVVAAALVLRKRSK